MTRTWLRTRVLGLDPWEHRPCIAVELDERTLLYISEGGHIEIQSFDGEPIQMPFNWELLVTGEP